MRFHKYIFTSLLLLIVLTSSASASAQALLERKINLDIKKEKLGDVLKQIGKQGNFSFSYNANIVKRDSLVSIAAANRSVRQVLVMLFGDRYEYREQGKHVIIQTAEASQFWYISGYVIDQATGERVSNASVYEPQQLVASLTNDAGYFKLKLKDKHPASAISISKLSYRDTSIIIKPGVDQEFTVNIATKNYELDSVTVSPNKSIEDTWIGQFFLSSKQRMQSLNLGKFLVDKPYQLSVTPGLGTHGRMASQVENKVSVNMLGGYSAAVNGVEIGGLFNIVKKDMRYAQMAGLFNIVGGKVRGVQGAGLFNQVLDSVSGGQLAGLFNVAGSNVYGVQAAGLYNHTPADMRYAQMATLANYTGDTAHGIQAAGVANVAGGEMRGAQIAGVANIASSNIEGVQVSGVFNYAKNLRGVQVGIVNVCDSSSGYSLGLLNFVRHGYHKFSISTNEVLQINASVKTGTGKLYTILTGGFNPGEKNRVASFGYGLGRQIPLGRTISLNPELTGQHLYLGDWDHANLLGRASLQLNVQLHKYISIYGGPAFSIYYSDQDVYKKDFKSDVKGSGVGGSRWDANTSSWFGWNLGISLF